MSRDTIFALSSGSPPAAISVIRISGPGARSAGEALAGSLPPARAAAVRQLRSSEGELLDEALVLRFEAPASSTGEDSVEFHCHGGRAVVSAVLGALESLDGLREARPGEFTRRAFENGRIDLTEAEGLADLIEAETESQRRSALMMAEGGLRRLIDSWQRRILDLSAQAEASIDYVDEASVDIDLDLRSHCAELAKDMQHWLERPRFEPLKDGVRVVIAGPPNSGKSSLLNVLAGSERAIVTDTPGTTRDHIEVWLALEGVPIRLTDTAGLRDSDELAEQIGVQRARKLAELADVLVWLGDPGSAPAHERLLRIHPRCDLPGREAAPAGTTYVSSRTGEGIPELTRMIADLAKSILPIEGELALNKRQAECIAGARDALQEVQDSTDVVLIAESLRQARADFDRLTGRARVDDLLDSLFGRFCLGK